MCGFAELLAHGCLQLCSALLLLLLLPLLLLAAGR
jgi:hypothetical protein